MVASSSLWSIVLLASASLVAGHGAIVRAVGDAGGEGAAIGVDPATPRDDTRRNSGQQDSTRFKGDAADGCGETLGGGTNDVATGVSAVMAMTGGLPQVSDGGMLMMTLHQVNGDGAGPYQCMIDTTGTGANWQAATVVENVPGNNGRDRDGATTDFPLTMQVPAGTTCTGTAPGAGGAMCMARCENPANAGPFGGCVPFQMAGAGAAGNTTAAAPAAAAAAPAAAARKLKLRSAKMARRAVIDEETDEFWTKK